MDSSNPEKENKNPDGNNSRKRDAGSRSSSTDGQNGTVASVPEADDFTLLKPISRGAFGKVFIGCKKNDPEKIYAIKVMKKTDLINKNLIAQVTTERDALAMIHSPFVVKIYYSLQSEQNIYLVMEYLVGGDVKSLLAVYGFLGEDVSSMYAAEVTLALEHLHYKGIVHRDLKPDNMLIAGNGHIKLTDFGLSKVTLDVNTTPRTANLMTPASQLDQYRTPGQILSLRSSLAFSASKHQDSKSSAGSRNSSTRKSLLSSSSPRVPCGSSGVPMNPLVNSPLVASNACGSWTTSLQQQWATQSIFSPRTPKPSRAQRAPFVKSLTPTLKDSLLWKHSLSLESNDSSSSEPQPSHSSSLFAGDISHAHGNQPLHDSSVSSNDDVFSSTHHDIRDLSVIAPTPGEKENSELDCLSHDRASSRQESLLDSTPLLHRTDESVYNSFSARNLRSFREGSPVEDSEAEEGSCTDLSPCQYRAARLELVPEESESLTSSQGSVSSTGKTQDGESGGGSQVSRKRCYDVMGDSTGHGGSSHTGLTQEVFVMQLGGVKQQGQGHVRARRCSSKSEGSDSQMEVSLDCEEAALGRSDHVPRKIRITSIDSTTSESSDRRSPPALPTDDCQTPKDLQTAPLPGLNLSGFFNYSMVSSPEMEDPGNVSVGSDGEAGETAKPFQLHLPNLELDTVAGKVQASRSGKAVDVKTERPREVASLQGQLSSKENALMSVPKAPVVKPRHKLPKNVDFKDVGRRSPHKVCCMSVTSIRLGQEEHQGVPVVDLSDYSMYKTPERPITAAKMAIHSDFITPQRQPLSMTQPLRTPKEGVRRGPDPRPDEGERILGTPDYLAPEILRQEKHGPAVDWWSLGVCLFEFLTGLPPFNDETPELVFNNILNRAISWPTDMSEVGEVAQQAINALLTMDPRKRPGAPQVKSMALFSKLDWERLLETEPAFIPKPDNMLDTSYFDPKNTMQQLTISAVDL